MYTDNTCFFIPFHKDYHSIHTIHMVLETQPYPYNTLSSEAVFKMHYVYSGNGQLHTMGYIQPLIPGDVFFTFPGAPYRLESGNNFSYAYISFLGSRSNMILNKLKINENHCLFHDCDEILPLWNQALQINPELSDLISESLLLYTFSFLGNRMLIEENTKSYGTDTVAILKKYIDDHFTQPDFSLDRMSEELRYNKKYLSRTFKKKMNIGIIEYLNTIRIQHACTMIRQGFTSINDISFRCGYNDPGYFSKIFKEHMKLTPTAYINELQQH